MYNHLRDEYIELSPDEEKYNTHLFPPEFQPIIDLFAEDVGCVPYRQYIHEGRLFITGYNEETEAQNSLMLRLGNKVKKQLTIARISFANQRQGYCTRLINILTEIGIKEGYEAIEIEAIASDEMMNFCDKHGFVNYPSKDLKDIYKPMFETNNRYKYLD